MSTSDPEPPIRHPRRNKDPSQKHEKIGAEKFPPKDRGELHFGGVAVFTRPFSGLLSNQTHRLWGSFAHREKAIGIRQEAPRGAFWTALGPAGANSPPLSKLERRFDCSKIAQFCRGISCYRPHSPRSTRRARENETGMKVTLKNGPQRHRAAERETERIKDQSSYSRLFLCA